MKVMFKVRFIYLLLAVLLLVQPMLSGYQIVKADSWVFQDDFSGPLLWSKVVGTPGPGSPQPPAVTGDIAIEDGELHVKADYWWYQVHAVRTFSGVTGDFLASARFRIIPDSGDASSADILVGTGPFSDTSNPNVLAALGTDAYYHQWVILVQGVEVKRIAATVPKDTWVQVGIGRTAGVLRFMVDGTELFQCPAPPSPAIDRMALGTSIGIHWEGGPHAHFDDAGFFAGSVPEGALFSDDFESYAVGTFPSPGGWQLVFDGRGSQYQVVVNSVSVSGTKSFQLWGTNGWSATAERHFSTGAEIIGFEAYVRAEDYHSSEFSATVGFWNRDKGTWGTKYAVVQFTADGFIQGASFKEARNLQSYAPDTWYKVKLLLDRSTDTFSVWVDGELRASGIMTGSSYDIDAIEVDSRWGRVQCYYDDVKVFAGGAGVNSPPNTPSNSSPANHATGVSINADLSWIGGDPDTGDTVTYDVYFGTSSSPPLASDNQAGTSYDPGTVAYNTKYYWKIIATDSHGASTMGPVWDFTTEPAPDTTPPAAVANLAVSQVTTNSATLTWKAPGDDGNAGTATLYDIRYSTSQVTQANWASATQATGEPSPKATGSGETFIVTGLQAGKTYYFALKTADEVPNWSGLSNVVSGTTTKGLTDADWLRILETAQNNTQMYSHDRSKVFNSDWWHQVADGLADAESDLWNPLEFSAKSVFKMLLPQVFGSLTLFGDAYEITKDLVYCGSVMLYDNVCAAVGAANAQTGNAVPRDLDDLLATEASLIAASQAHNYTALESSLLQEKQHIEQLYGHLAWFDRELYFLCLDETRMGAEGLARNTYNPLRRHIVALRTSLEGTYKYTTYLLGEEKDLSAVGAQLDARNCEPLIIEAYWEVNGQKVTTVPKDTTVNVHVVVKPRDSSRYDPGSFSGNIVVEIRQDWLGLDEPYGSASFDITTPITGDQTEPLQFAFVPKQSSSFLLRGYFIRARYSGNDAFLRYQQDQNVYFVTESGSLSKEMENSYPPRLKVTGSSASFAVYSPANLMVKDPLGRRVGFDPTTNSVVMEIPGAWYSGTSLEPQGVAIPDPLDGYYSTLLVGTSTGTYSLISELIPIEGGTTTLVIDDIPIATDARHRYTVDWDALSEDGPGVTIEIDADGDGDFEETIFTSQPNVPSNPWPANHATGVSINTDLGWSGGDPDAEDMVTYNVYFGISEIPPLVSDNQAGTSYDPGTLAYNTKYYWKIVALDNHGVSTTGPLCDFTTQVAPGPSGTFPWWWVVVGIVAVALLVYLLWWRRR
jgi:hypothetical protein